MSCVFSRIPPEGSYALVERIVRSEVWNHHFILAILLRCKHLQSVTEVKYTKGKANFFKGKKAWKKTNPFKKIHQE